MHQIESFFWGIIAALGALFVEFVAFLIVSMTTNNPTMTSGDFLSIPAMIILAAAAEELMKLIIISKRIEAYSLYRTFVINAMFVGLGFATTEIFFIREFSLPGAQDLRSLIMISLVHISISAYIGYQVAMHARKTVGFFISTLIVATAMHAIYNIIIFANHELSSLIATFYALLLAFLAIINLIRVKSRLAQ